MQKETNDGVQAHDDDSGRGADFFVDAIGQGQDDKGEHVYACARVRGEDTAQDANDEEVESLLLAPTG